jgi:myo-inositol-1(or 4)-monophosphatase
MSDKNLHKYLEFAKTLSNEAGEIMLKYFSTTAKKTTWKQDSSPVTIADIEINQLVIERVKNAFPDHGVVGEERSFEESRDFLWVVDPIDGTAPYDIGMPCSTFCLALVERGVVQVAVVLDPFLNRLFYAIKRGGTFLNGRHLKIAKGEGESRYAFVPSGTKKVVDAYGPVIGYLKDRGYKISFIPSFTYLATFVLEGTAAVCLMDYGSPWDAAAISLLVQEAGGRATGLDGLDRRYDIFGNGIVVSNGTIHNEVIELIDYANNRH